MNNKNLVIIDYQNDFVKIDGSLTCGEPAIAIENNIVNKIEEYKKNNIFVTFDTHVEADWQDDSKSCEGKLFPKHCVMNTNGHELYGKVKTTLENIHYTKIYKNTYATAKLAKELIMKNNVNEKIFVEFTGVATNICVFQNIIMLYNHFVTNGIEFEIILNKNCVASFDATLEEQSLNYLVNTLGITVK